MQLEDRTYYEEEQKMESNWMLIIILVMTISSLAIAVGVLYSSNTDWLQIGIVAAAIIFSDLFIIVLFKSMKLELAITKKGLHYKMVPMAGKQAMVEWDSVIAMSIKKSPARGYGKKVKYKYGELYTMNMKHGLELTLQNGKKKFFSLKDADEFKKAFRKLELPLQIE